MEGIGGNSSPLQTELQKESNFINHDVQNTNPHERLDKQSNTDNGVFPYTGLDKRGVSKEERPPENDKKIEEDTNKAQSKLQRLEEEKKDIEAKLNGFEKTVEEKQKNLENFEKSWIIGKLKTGWQKSTWGQRLQTFAKIAITFAISITASVMSGGLVPALLVASLSIGLLYGIAKNVINIAKEKLMSELSETRGKAICSAGEAIKNATGFISKYADDAKKGINGCINNLEEQKTGIDDLNEQIKNLNENFQKAIKSKNDQIDKQKREIAEITKDLASTISSSLESSAKVIEKAKANINKIEKAENDIQAITGDCNEISQKSQKIKSLSDSITNKIEKFNKTTVDKLKKFVETKDDGTVFEKSKLSRLLSKEETTKNNTEKLSKKIDDLEDEIFTQKLDKLYSKTGFSAEESEDLNETIKKLIDKISKSNVDPTKFAELLVKITKDQNQMNKYIKVSSRKISKLAEEINKDHAKKTKELIIQISDVLVNIKQNEMEILNEQKTLTKNYLSSAKEVFNEFLEKDKEARLNYLQEEFCKHYPKNSNECFSKEFFDEVVQIINQASEAEVKSLTSTQLEGVNKILTIIINKDNTIPTKEEQNMLKQGYSLQSIFSTLEEINSLNDTCKSSLSEINDKDIGGIIANAERINESVEKIQKHAKNLKIKTTDKSSNVTSATAGAFGGMIAGGLAGPVAIAVGTIGLISLGIGKFIKAMKKS